MIIPGIMRKRVDVAQPNQAPVIDDQVFNVALGGMLNAVSLGDSITYLGYGPGTGLPESFSNSSYQSYMLSRLSGIRHVYNYGVSGRSMVTMAESANLDPVVAHSADMCIFLMSGNDLEGSTYQEITDAIDTIVNGLVGSGKTVVLGLITPRDSHTSTQKTIRSNLNAYATSLASVNSSVILADTYAPLADGAGDPISGMLPDGTHPGIMGAFVLGAAFSSAVIADGRYTINRLPSEPSGNGSLETATIDQYTSSATSGVVYSVTDGVAGYDGDGWTEIEITSVPSGLGDTVNINAPSLLSGWTIGDEVLLAFELEIEDCVDIRSIIMNFAANPAWSIGTSRNAGTSGFLTTSAHGRMMFVSAVVAIPSGQSTLRPRIQIVAGSLSTTATIRLRNPQVISATDYPGYFDDRAIPLAHWSILDTVQASDPELDTLTYSIIAGNTDGDLDINPDTGELTWVNAPDPTRTAIYNLTVQVTDGTDTSQAAVTINVMAQPEQGVLPTWRGYDDGSGAHNGSITADDVVLDLQDDLTIVAPNLVRVDQGTIVHNPTGGFDGNGCNILTPNYNPGAGVEQHCGLGQIQGLLARPDNTKFVLGWRFRFGTGFKQIILRQGSYKHTIAETDPNDAQHVRQMLATQQGTITNIIGPANGTIFNSTDDPGGNPLMFNENNGVPDCDVLGDVWCWANWIVDVNYNDPTYGMVGLNELRLWSADGTYDGTQVVRQFMTNGGGNGETYGAPLVRFDNLFCWVPALSETTPADPGYDLDYVRLIMGRNTPLSPTPGFQGHNASDWP